MTKSRMCRGRVISMHRCSPGMAAAMIRDLLLKVHTCSPVPPPVPPFLSLHTPLTPYLKVSPPTTSGPAPVASGMYQHSLAMASMDPSLFFLTSGVLLLQDQALPPTKVAELSGAVAALDLMPPGPALTSARGTRQPSRKMRRVEAGAPYYETARLPSTQDLTRRANARMLRTQKYREFVHDDLTMIMDNSDFLPA